MSDGELLERYRQTGDQALVGELYHRYRHLVFGVCLKYLKNAEEARDATTALFEKMITDLRQCEVRMWTHWLHRVTRNYCLSLLRKRVPSADSESALMKKGDDSAEELQQAEARESRLQQLEQAISQLDEHQRICITMFYLLEKSYREIVAETGYTELQVKSYIQNGRRNLKNALMEP